MYDTQNITVALSRIQDDTVKNEEIRIGFYRATVVQNTDPYNIGRIKIRIPSFHGANPDSSYYITDENLPYAYPATLNAAGYKMGSYLLPVVGSLVWVSFETGTDNFVYFGGIYTAEPTGNRYIYFDRSVNEGEPIQIVEDDIPSDYNPNKYVVFRSPKGAMISVDDRDAVEDVEILDTHGNSIIMNSNGINLNSVNFLHANFPYLASSYIAFVDDAYNSTFIVSLDDIFTNMDLQEKATVVTGSRVIYVENNKCVGSGIIVATSGNEALISSNGVSKSGEAPGPVEVTSYNDLDDRPSINNVTLEGNRDLAEIPLTNSEIERLLR